MDSLHEFGRIGKLLAGELSYRWKQVQEPFRVESRSRACPFFAQSNLLARRHWCGFQVWPNRGASLVKLRTGSSEHGLASSRSNRFISFHLAVARFKRNCKQANKWSALPSLFLSAELISSRLTAYLPAIHLTVEAHYVEIRFSSIFVLRSNFFHCSF